MRKSLWQFLFANNLGLSPSISSQFTLLQPKVAKKSLKINIFRAQGHSRSSMLTFLRSPSPVHVMISSIHCHNIYSWIETKLLDSTGTNLLKIVDSLLKQLVVSSQPLQQPTNHSSDNLQHTYGCVTTTANYSLDNIQTESSCDKNQSQYNLYSNIQWHMTK